MTCCNHTHREKTDGSLTIGRRSFIKLAAVAGGTTLFFAPARRAAAAGKAQVLLLNCMDYRLVDDIHEFMETKGLEDQYDQIILAGASAGVLHEAFAGWHETFWTHLDVAVDLHGIHKVMVIDHRDCSAYKIAFGPEHANDPVAETKVHSEMMAVLAATLKARKPELEFEGYLMALDGSVEEITV